MSKKFSKQEETNYDSKKGTKRNSKSSKKYSEKDSSYDTKDKQLSSRNHIEWYVPDAKMLNDVASLSFPYRLGDEMRFSNIFNPDLRSYSEYEPGIAAFQFIPTLGRLTEPQSAGNLAANAAFTFIRSTNAGGTNYDATSLMMYYAAMDSVYMGIEWLKRLYGIVRFYSMDNKYVPNTLLHAMGISTMDPNYTYAGSGSLFTQLPQIRAAINELIYAASVLCVPEQFPLFQRHEFMCKDIYVDNVSAKAQIYFFNPQYLYKFGLDEEGKGELVPYEWADANNPVTWDIYYDRVKDLLSTIIDNQSFRIMSGDIRKAYGDAGLKKLYTIDDSYALLPIYAPDVLNQMHNSTPVGDLYVLDDDYNAKITQVIEDTGDNIVGYLKQELHTVDEAADLNYTRWFDLEYLPNAPEHIMRGTRLTAGSVYPDSIKGGLIKHYGTEVLLRVNVFGFYPDGTDLTYRLKYHISQATVNDKGMLDRMSLMDHLEHMPAVVYSYINGSEPVKRMLFRTNYSTLIEPDKIDKLHDVAILGTFNSPRIALGFKNIK